MWDAVGKLVTDLKDATAVQLIAGRNPTANAAERARVASPEPAVGWAKQPGSYLAFVVVQTLATPPHPSVPLSRQRHVIKCYGRNAIEAGDLYEACSEELHHKGPRRSGEHAIYVSHDDTGGDYSTDPDTGQPLYTFIVETLATTQVVA